MDEPIRSQEAPDPYDRQLAMLHDLPDVVKTKTSPIRHIPLLGVGGTQSFLVQTYRQRERGDTIFLEVSGQNGTVRLVIPPKVANTIARQREALTTKVRSRIAKARAADLAAQGIKPDFKKKKAAS